MSASKDPTVQRRQLLVELRRARSDAGFTQRQVAEALDWSPSKLLRIENGSVGVTAVDLRALLGHYGITDTTRVADLVQIAKFSKKQPFAEYRDVLSQPLMTYLGFEASASVNRQFQPQVVPGLLQTQEYATALLSATQPAADKRVINRIIESRLERQELLDRDDAGEFFFLLDEAVIRRAVGGRRTMTNQLEHLKALGSRQGVNIMVIPFSAGAHYGMGGPFILLEFSDPNTDNLLYVENDRGDMVSRDAAEEIADRVDIFWAMESLATAPSDINRVIDRAIEGLSSSAAPVGTTSPGPVSPT